MNACFSLKVFSVDGSHENLGTILNISNAQEIPSIDSTGIFASPKYCAIVDDNKGPIENPNVPIAMNIPMFLATSDFENFEINPSDCG